MGQREASESPLENAPQPSPASAARVISRISPMGGGLSSSGERERGITIKANTVTLPYTARDGKTYELNLIDTPGHVDFSHEVRRSLMSCEGALLVIDASQGVEAQTVANLYLAVEFGLTVVPVINAIDLPSADVDRVMEEIDRDLGLDPFASIQVSAKPRRPP